MRANVRLTRRSIPRSLTRNLPTAAPPTCRGVQAAGRLIQQQDAGVDEQLVADAHALALAACSARHARLAAGEQGGMRRGRMHAQPWARHPTTRLPCTCRLPSRAEGLRSIPCCSAVQARAYAPDTPRRRWSPMMVSRHLSRPSALITLSTRSSCRAAPPPNHG